MSFPIFSLAVLIVFGLLMFALGRWSCLSDNQSRRLITLLGSVRSYYIGPHFSDECVGGYVREMISEDIDVVIQLRRSEHALFGVPRGIVADAVDRADEARRSDR